MKTWGPFIDGTAEVWEGETIDVIAPATGQVSGEIAACDATVIQRAVETAATAFPAWAEMWMLDRGRLLGKCAEAIRVAGPELAQLEHEDTGKSLAAASAEMEQTAEFFDYYGGLAAALEGATVPGKGVALAYTRREPYGVTGHIIPWNYTASTLARSLAPALAVGNVAVAKPAEDASVAILRLAEVLGEAGLPQGVFNVVPGAGAVAGAALASHPLVRRLAFTGSVATGRAVATMALEHMCHATLELGGKSANVVLSDADVEAAATGVVTSILANAGQLCSAGSRVLVHGDLYDSLVDGVAQRFESLQDLELLKQNLPPLISERQLRKVEQYVQEAVGAGATLRVGSPEAPDCEGFFYRPVLLEDVTPEMDIFRAEVFGPVLVAVRFESDDDAVGIANDSEYGLAAGVWSQRGGRAIRVAHEIEAGTVYINGYFAGGIALPFGGMKNSGYGREKGIQAIDDYSRTKSVSVVA